MINYSYKISESFVNGVSGLRLEEEIRYQAISIALDSVHVNVLGDDCDVLFKGTLTQADKILLDQVIASHTGEALSDPTLDINITSSDVDLNMHAKGFHDLTGHSVVRFGDLLYDIVAGEHNIFMESFAVGMWLEGGGTKIPEYMYVNGAKIEYKPEKGDYCVFDMVDIDNKLGYGNSQFISKVTRLSNIATITTTTDHGFVAGQVVCVSCNDNTFDDMEEEISTVPNSTTFTYVNNGDDVSEKDGSGDVGVIVVLGAFVPRDYMSPGDNWQCIKGDAKYIPGGIYLRFRYVSVGDTDVVAMPFYSMRT
jgi:hypothetical protein